MADALRLNIGAPMTMATEGTPAYTNQALTTQNWKVGWVYMMPYADIITGLGFRYGARTTTPPQHTISLQSVDASGLPSGTILGGGSPASATFTPPADATWDGTWQWVTLSNNYLTTAGQMVAVVVDCTGNPSAGSSSFTRNVISCLSYLQGLPYQCTNSGSWAKGGNSYQAVFGLKSATRVYGLPIQGTTVRSTATTGNRIAMKFTLPSGWGSTFRVLGARTISQSATSLGTYKFGLWNGVGTLLQGSAAVDTDTFKSTSNYGNEELYFIDALATLSFGTTYYIGFECESSITVRLSTIDLPSAGDLLAFPLPALYSSWNGSAWSDIATSMPWMELILDDITPPPQSLILQPTGII